MSEKLIITSVKEFIELLENRAQTSRENIGKTRTKLESNELKGEVHAFNEAIYYAKALERGLDQENGSAN